jgi:hypothetical protein
MFGSYYQDLREKINHLFAMWRCAITWLVRHLLGMPPSVRCWLLWQSTVASSIKWQFRSETSEYVIPETAKRRYPDWSVAEKNELQAAFNAAWNWLEAQSATFDVSSEDLSYPPANLIDTSDDDGAPWTRVDEAWARDFYLRWVALALAVEIGNRVPWSITTYTEEELQVLFDSAAMMTRHASSGFTLVTAIPYFTNYVHRKDNLGTSLPAPPWYTYAFLANGAMIGATRLDTIGNLLQWISDNCGHSYGHFTYQETDNHWQYRGNPPITRIIEGTTNRTLFGGWFNNWTAGCHGTAGLIRNVLRAVNIPVHISRVCNHAQAVFLTENLYLDHCDNPYNSRFTTLELPATDLLIDHATYVSWFGSSTDNREEGCDKINNQVNVLAGR